MESSTSNIHLRKPNLALQQYIIGDGAPIWQPPRKVKRSHVNEIVEEMVTHSVIYLG